VIETSYLGAKKDQDHRCWESGRISSSNLLFSLRGAKGDSSSSFFAECTCFKKPKFASFIWFKFKLEQLAWESWS